MRPGDAAAPGSGARGAASFGAKSCPRRGHRNGRVTGYGQYRRAGSAEGRRDERMDGAVQATVRPASLATVLLEIDIARVNGEAPRP
jgi:hypothetical protein